VIQKIQAGRNLVIRVSFGCSEARAVPKLRVARPARNKAEDIRVLALAAARWAPVDAVLCARIVALSWSGARVSVIAARLGCHPQAVRRCLHQFNTKGLNGLVLHPVKAIDTVQVADCYL
jgi:hypothetical protein